MNEVLVIIECSWKKGARFFSFGLAEAFWTRMLARCTVVYEKVVSSRDFEHMIDSFVARTMKYTRSCEVPGWHMYIATARVWSKQGRKAKEVNFGTIAVFKDGQMVTLQIEPYGPIPPDLDEWFEEASAYVKRMDPSKHFPDEIRDQAFTITDVSVHGFEIGMEMMGYIREDSEYLEAVVWH